jgi:hypothetical protein
MSCFTEMRALATGAPDPTKHVNFVRGMVLGEDDFKQEFAWLSGRDQWLARDAVGYGTLRGLKVQVEPDGGSGPRIYVHPGAALTPAGQLVCVPAPQCADLNDWLLKHADAVASPPQNPLSLYVVLCYRECPTDNVPIPGEPCRSEDQLVQPSRLRDDFVLEISLKAPEHREERALSEFCRWLRQVDMTDDTVTSPPLPVFLEWLRSRGAAPDSPPPASPPEGPRVHPDDAAAYLRAAFHLWTTELRPKWHGRWYGCAPGEKEPAPLEDCVLLAEIQVPLVFNAATGAYQVSDAAPAGVIDAERPYLLHLRMLQEWLIGGASGLPAGASGPVAPPILPNLGGDASGPIANATVSRVRGVDVITGPANAGQVLMFESGRWLPRALPDFVRRGATQNYRIVAAGQVEFALTPVAGTQPPTGTPANVLAAYNGFRAITPYDPSVGGFRFTFTGYSTSAVYVVKLTPWAGKGSGSGNPFLAWFSDFVPAAGGLPAGFIVTISVNPTPGTSAGRLMVEVSQIG